MSAEPFKPGAVIEIGWPFSWDKRNELDEDVGSVEQWSWRPGTREASHYDGDYEKVADGMGTMILTIVSTHRPGDFPWRIFFTRRWRDPAQREFGTKNRRLHVKSSGQFTQLTRGFRRFTLLQPHEITDRAPVFRTLEKL